MTPRCIAWDDGKVYLSDGSVGSKISMARAHQWRGEPRVMGWDADRIQGRFPLGAKLVAFTWLTQETIRSFLLVFNDRCSICYLVHLFRAFRLCSESFDVPHTNRLNSGNSQGPHPTGLICNMWIYRKASIGNLFLSGARIFFSSLSTGALWMAKLLGLPDNTRCSLNGVCSWFRNPSTPAIY